jgi:hypothetical protein
MVKGTDMGEYYEHALKERFKRPPNGPGMGRPLTGGHRARDSSGASCPFSPGGGDPGQLHVLDRPLPGVFEDPEVGSRTLLRELLATAGKLPPVQKCLVRQCYRESPNNLFPRMDHHQSGSDLEVDMAYTQNRYRWGRNGDHLMGVPFECDLCSFRNVAGRDPDFSNDWDEFTLTAIRRVLLDVMWAREPDTVASN